LTAETALPRKASPATARRSCTHRVATPRCRGATPRALAQEGPQVTPDSAATPFWGNSKGGSPPARLDPANRYLTCDVTRTADWQKPTNLEPVSQVLTCHSCLTRHPPDPGHSPAWPTGSGAGDGPVEWWRSCSGSRATCATSVACPEQTRPITTHLGPCSSPRATPTPTRSSTSTPPTGVHATTSEVTAHSRLSCVPSVVVLGCPLSA
jgi:hypothetical protein